MKPIVRHAAFLCAAFFASVISAEVWAMERRAPPSVVASILPVHSLVAGVMKGTGEPSLLMKQGASPHHYALRPSDARLLREADVIFWIGPSIEEFLSRPLKSLGRDAMRVSLFEEEGHEEEHDDEAHHDDMKEAHDDHHEAHHDEDGHDDHAHGDAHIWLDPLRAIEMTRDIAAALSQADPARKSRYKRNARRQIRALRALHKEIKTQMRPLKRVPYVVFHDSHRHFRDRYSLREAGFITLTPERRPSAKHLSDLRRMMKKMGVLCLFSEPNSPETLMKLVSGWGNYRSAELDILGADIAEDSGAQAYFTLMRRMSGAMAGCLERGMAEAR